MLGGHLESQTGQKKEKRQRKGNLMKHGDKPWVTDHLLPFCLSRPPLLSRQGWAKQQVVQKRSQDMGNLWLSDFCTGQAWRSIKSQNLKSKCCFWFPHLCYYLWLWHSALCVVCLFHVLKTWTVCSKNIGIYETLIILYIFVNLKLMWCLFNFNVDGATCPVNPVV